MYDTHLLALAFTSGQHVRHSFADGSCPEQRFQTRQAESIYDRMTRGAVAFVSCVCKSWRRITVARHPVLFSTLNRMTHCTGADGGL